MNKFIVNVEKRLSIKLTEGVTAKQLAVYPSLQGHIGATSLQALLTGRKDVVNGFQVVAQLAPSQNDQRGAAGRANKLGIAPQTKGIRNRLPMQIYCSLSATGQRYVVKSTGDMQSFLLAIKQTGTAEYSELSSVLGWTRDMVSIYAAAACGKGLINKVRNSNRINHSVQNI